MNAYLEHANMHVADVDAMLDFITTAFPEFRVRHDSGHEDPERWVHVGDEHTYLAIYRADKPRQARQHLYSGEVQLNHLGFVAEDVEALRQRLLARGFEETTIPNHHPARKRIYFQDREGNEWEFVEYLSAKVGERNDYSGLG